MKSSDYQQGYADGFDDMQSTAFKETRLEAFAAIRRAASEARVYDRYSKDLASREIHDTARMYESWAGVIRQAIRTAIGSEKA